VTTVGIVDVRDPRLKVCGIVLCETRRRRQAGRERIRRAEVCVSIEQEGVGRAVDKCMVHREHRSLLVSLRSNVLRDDHGKDLVATPGTFLTILGRGGGALERGGQVRPQVGIGVLFRLLFGIAHGIRLKARIHKAAPVQLVVIFPRCRERLGNHRERAATLLEELLDSVDIVQMGLPRMHVR